MLKMKLCIVTCIVTFVQAGTIKESNESNCEGVKINGVNYEQEILKSGLDRPYLLATDYLSNTIYFSYSLNLEDDIFKTAKLNVDTKEFNDIEGVNNGFAQTVDQKTHEVYIGGSDGIYKYDPKTKVAEFIGQKDSNIWTIFYKDNLYYSDFPSQFLYTLVDSQSIKFKDLEDTKVDNFIIDNDDEMFFTNSSGLYSQKKGTKEAVLYEEFSQTSSGVRGLTTDTKGNVYLCLQDGIYAIKKSSNSLDKVVDIEDAFGVTFDKTDNIIYSDATSIIRLKPNKNKSC